MRKILALLGVAVSLFAAPAWSQSKITIGYTTSTDFVPVFLAQDDGLFAKHGLDVTLIQFPSASSMSAALSSHSIDIGVGTMPPLLFAVENGIDFVVISGFTRNLASNPQTSLMVRTGLAYQGPADLEGKRVGTPGLLSSFDVHFRTWLNLHNVPLDRINLVEAPPPQMNDMLKSGTLDAAIVIEPFRSAIVKSGAGFRAADFLGEVTPDDAGAVWMTMRDWAVAHPKERAAFRASLEEGVAAIARDPAAATAAMQKYLKFVAPMAGDWSFDFAPADIEFYQDMMLKLGMLHQKIDVAKLIVQ